jgi:membrane-bound serine protease (ClpP class)
MNKTRIYLMLLMLGVIFLSTTVLGEQEPAVEATAVRIVVDGPISPVTADYIERGIQESVDSGAALLILQLDTPGGLMTSTRQIVKALLNAEVPVAVHVAPPGARAASAGVFITMASHVAAMAPGTNIGAAHPVNIGGGNPFAPKEDEPEKEKTGKEEKKEKDEGRSAEGEDKEKDEDTKEAEKDERALDDESIMAQKIINDTVAFARSIAEKQGRNADWAERAVRESVSVTEKEALELNVIDIVAEGDDELLQAMDGRTVNVSGEEVTLTVADASITELPMGWRHRILMALSDPNVAYILMMLGIYGLFFELANPGVILPGVLGGIFLILAFFSFQVLPINYAGILLILVAVILFMLEVKVVSYGMLSVGGIVSLFLGSIMLFESAEPYYRLSGALVIGVTAFTALFFVVGLGLAVRAQRKKPTTGMEGLVGEKGVVTVALKPEGKIKVHGEIWTATSSETLSKGTSVRVLAAEGMILKVEEEKDK